MTSPLCRLTRVALVTAAVSLWCWALPGSAALVSFDVRLVQPGPNPGDLDIFNVFSDAVAVDPDVGPGHREIFSGDGTDLGDVYLLANEFIDASTTSIFVRLEGGAGDMTGYQPGAYLEFSDFVLAGPLALVGITVSSSEVTDFGTPVYQPGSNSLRLPLDTPRMPLLLCDGGSTNCGTLELALEFDEITKVPEPSSYVLLAGGLIAIASAAARRKKQR
jgi:hypothetical protein